MNRNAQLTRAAGMPRLAAGFVAVALLCAGAAQAESSGTTQARKGAVAHTATPTPGQAAPAGTPDATGATGDRPLQLAANQPASLAPQTAAYAGPTEVAPSLALTVGKSALVRLPADAKRLSIGNPAIADVMLINPREVYLLGKKVGSTNVFVWSKSDRTTIMDIVVGVDTQTLSHKLSEFVPGENGIRVDSLADSVVLSGRVSDPIRVQRLVSLAEVYSGAKKVVNLLTVDGSQQVMLEVKVAEVSKTLLDSLGFEINAARTIGNTSFTLLTQFLSGAAGTLSGVTQSGRTAMTLDAQVKRGLVKILAEPTIMATSGQEGSFLSGGKIFIPVPQSGAIGTTGITLEEKEFGVGLRFRPTVLEEGRINLQVTPEVSELSQVGTTVTSLAGQNSVLPTITTRRASTTVQLRDGETFAIGGLIKNNVTEAVKAFPLLGELPVIGALFRSSEFQTDRSELMFVVTPRIVKPIAAGVRLPTDSFVEPSRPDFLINGRMEGASKAAPAQPAPAQSEAAPMDGTAGAATGARPSAPPTVQPATGGPAANGFVLK